MPGAQDYATLWRTARRRFRSGEDYRAFQRTQGNLLLAYFRSRGLVFSGQRVLDVGCGWGGYSQLLRADGADVVSVDLEVHADAADDVRRGMVVADGQALPLRANQFEFVFCASLIEHVPQPECLVAEVQRVLRPGGRCYVGFPPFYSPAGGHQFKPFHLLGERAAIALSRQPGRTFAAAGGGWGLYRRTIRQVRRLLDGTGLVIEDISTKFLPLSFARLPVLGEFLTWYVQFLARKPGA